jgi:hypothetical protein
MSKPKTTRRQFAKTVAALAAAPLVLDARPAKAAQPAPAAPAREPIAAAADALTEIVRVRHGTHLTEEQLRRVRQSIQSSLRSVERLRRFPLRNSDEPAFVFSADIS